MDVFVSMEGHTATAVLGAIEHNAKQSRLRLCDLPTDVLQDLYLRVPFQFVLRLVCRALRDAGPKKTEIPLSVAVHSAAWFRWALRIDCPFEWNEKLSERMAMHGAVNALLWARTHDLKWDSRTVEKAAKHGHLAILQLVAREWPGALANKRLDPTMFGVQTFAYAAAGGNAEVVRWLHEHGCAFDESACSGAARFGHLEVLKWLRQRDCPWNMWCLNDAAWGGHDEVIVWARANGCEWSLHAAMWAARKGHVSTLRLLRRMGCRWDEKACMWAAREGHLEALQYLRTGDGGVCPWDAKTCWAAAVAGHLEVLQWARANGCPWTWMTWAGAALTGQVHVLRWLRANGCPRCGVSKQGYAGGAPRMAGPNRGTVKYFCALRRWDKVRKAVAHRAFVEHWAGLAGFVFS